LRCAIVIKQHVLDRCHSTSQYSAGSESTGHPGPAPRLQRQQPQTSRTLSPDEGMHAAERHAACLQAAASLIHDMLFLLASPVQPPRWQTWRCQLHAAPLVRVCTLHPRPE
jgi:hypothetical protein